MGILNRLASFKPKFITHTIKMGEDQEFKFYPVPTLMLVSRELRESVGPIIEVVQSIIGGPAVNVTERHLETSPEGGVYEVIKGASIQTVDFMENLRRKSTTKALDTFLSDETRYVIGRLIGASLRDEFPSMTKEPKEFDKIVREFMDHENMDLCALFGFITGFIKANAAVLGLDEDGDLGKFLVDKVKAAVEAKIQDPTAPIDLRVVDGNGEATEDSDDPDSTPMKKEETEGAESAL